MGRATAPVDEMDRIEDFANGAGFDATLREGSTVNVRYYVSEKEGVIYHHERASTPDGTVLYDQTVPIDYEVGSGVRGRSYISNHDGVMFMSPMSWYSKSERWDLSPGYHDDNLHFERRINDACIHCHVGQLVPAEGLVDQFDVELPVLEAAISCERCHGPGEQHVVLQRGEMPTDPVDTIVNPSNLGPHLRDSVCYQCHFHGVERIPRYGRTEFDFRPGDDICDIWTVFVNDTGIDESATTQAVSQTEQMLSSVCYQRSEGRLGCVSCHDPHSLPTESQRVDYYRDRCLECHSSGESECSQPLAERLALTAEDSCIECHMPAIAANDVPHASQTDHRVLRVPEMHTPPPADNYVTIFGEGTGVIPEIELNRARAIFMVKQAEKSGNPTLAMHAVDHLANWVAGAPDDLLAIEALGTALAMRGESSTAIETWEQGLTLSPNHEGLLRRMMHIHQNQGQFELALNYGRRLLEVNPWDRDAWDRLARMLVQQGKIEQGIEAAQHALAIRPSNAQVHRWLADTYLLVNEQAKAAEHFRLFQLFQTDE